MKNIITFRVDEKVEKELDTLIKQSGLTPADFYRKMVDDTIQSKTNRFVIREELHLHFGKRFNEQERKMDEVQQKMLEIEKWFKWLQQNLADPK